MALRGIIFGLLILAQNAFASDLDRFRAEREESLKKNWLTLVGLSWLKDGENTVGSAADAAVWLPASVPTKFAKITKAAKTVKIEFFETKNVRLDGAAVQTATPYGMKTDTAVANTGQKPTTVEIDSVQFHLAERGDAIGVRSRDQNSLTLKNFKGVRWFPESKTLRIQAKYIKFKEPRTVKYQDVLNRTHEQKINGNVEFSVDGQKVTLTPVSEEEGFEFIFRDATSGQESYGAARYLSAGRPDNDNRVVLDFNRAINPPCAYTSFATCPLAPAENNLRVAVRAGEMKPLGKH